MQRFAASLLDSNCRAVPCAVDVRSDRLHAEARDSSIAKAYPKGQVQPGDQLQQTKMLHHLPKGRTLLGLGLVVAPGSQIDPSDLGEERAQRFLQVFSRASPASFAAAEAEQ